MSHATSVSGDGSVLEESNAPSVSGHASISEESRSSGNTGSGFSLGESRSSNSNGRDSSTRDDECIVKNQSTMLGKAKTMILIFLFALAGLTGWLWWRDATDSRQDLYRAALEQYGEKIAQVFLERVQYRATAAASLATSLSAHAVGASLEWPYVTFTNFERRVASTRRLTQSTSIWVAPLVTAEQRASWEAYAVENQDFHSKETFEDSFLTATDSTPIYKPTNWPISQGMYQYDGNRTRAREDGPNQFIPIWQAAPSKLTAGMSMFDQVSESMRGKVLENLIDAPLFSSISLKGIGDSTVNIFPLEKGPHVSLYAPIFQDRNIRPAHVVGSLTLDMTWQSFWEGSVHGLPAPLAIVLIGSSPSCGGAYTYELGDRNDTTYFSSEGLPSFSSKLQLKIETSFGDFADRLELGSVGDDICQYRIQVRPTEAFESIYLNDVPLLSAIAMGAIFIFTAAVFVCYDHFVQRRQNEVIASATRSTAIIRSLFPKGIRNKLLEDGLQTQHQLQRFEGILPEDYAMTLTNKMRLQNYLMPSNTQGRPNQAGENLGIEPIAEFFPSVTVMYADLSGFTAWSSTRDPAQVFTLLEAIYGSMDKAAKRLGVFKVETIGDCYIAATGMPDPRPDHAVLMAKFANLCLVQIKDLTSALESQLGPGTSDLAFRIGIHSGPVTAGVLRGEKSRFQLFGDTMTTCAKIEAAGRPGRIHTSSTTADMLIQYGKSSWLEGTGEAIVATGRGELVTHWLNLKGRKDGRLGSTRNLLSPSEGSQSGDEEQEEKANVADIPSRKSRIGMMDEINSKNGRLVDYNADVMISLLKKIISRRSVGDKVSKEIENSSRQGSIALDEVKEFVSMPEYSEDASVQLASNYRVEIQDVVREELRDYIVRIARMYPSNAFHNFEHASHVALSASKLLKRIVMPDEVNYRLNSKESTIEKLLAVTKELHLHTFGISSDPVAQFAVVFASLIHDVMHPGVPNGRFGIEEPDLAKKYRNQSLTEQCSIDIAWGILFEDSYRNLRSCMFPTVSELKHFRQLIVNMVMATDLFDKEINALRQARWQRCFHPQDFPFPDDGAKDIFDRKATIALEHIIQASDLAHTMQHWHVYLKWNERLFFEMYQAFKDGRSAVNPINDWYKGELWFFDNYVIPLAHKLKECGVFGVSSAEYLQYAVENRAEWERKGEDVCKHLLWRYEEIYGND